MKIRYLLSLIILLSGSLSAQNSPVSCSITAQAIRKASQIRGLILKKQVPCKISNKQQVEKFLRETIETKLPTDKLKFEELLYKKLGIIPEDYNYKDGIINLYLSQLGGYYDPESASYVMAGWMPTSVQEIVAVHELTHALQDQHYNLQKIIDNKLFNGDVSLAHSALVEGDATAVMTDFTAGVMGSAKLADTANIEMLLIQQLLGAGAASGFEDVPEPIKNTLLFPYTSGLRFVHGLLQNGGYAAVDSAFKRLPRSTEEILHPEKYSKLEADFVEIKPESLAQNPSDKLVYQDTIGEFLISSLLGSLLKDKVRGSQIAAGWGGDVAAIFLQDSGEYYVVWQTEWDTEGDAREFLDGYLEGVKKLHKGATHKQIGSKIVVFNF